MSHPTKMSWGLAGTALFLVSCGGSSGSGSEAKTLSGLIETDRFVLPKGESRRVNGDLTIRASDDIEILGRLLVDEGVEVNFDAQDQLTVAGIAPSGSASAAANRAGDTVDWVWVGRRADLNDGKEVPARTNVNVVCRGNGTSVGVHGEIKIKPGKAGTAPAEVGEKGGSFNVGGTAVLVAQNRGITGAVNPTQLTITAPITAGDGGNGGSDLNSRGTFSPDLNAGHGGVGGTIELNAATINVGNNLPLTAGKGGHAGWIGRQIGGGDGFAAVGNGTLEGQRGGDATARGGSGGSAGRVVVTATTVNGQARIPIVEGGQPTSIFITGGNGGPAGPGGSLLISLNYVQALRSDGTPVTRSDSLILRNVGNGGHGIAGRKDGGEGGSLRGFFNPLPPNIVVAASFKGGNGFDGCSVNPKTFGGTGGIGGHLFGNNLPTVVEDSWAGGNGGDYAQGQATAGGAKGRVNENGSIGRDGFPGYPCNIVEKTFIANEDIVFGDLILVRSGDSVLVKRFRGFHYSGPEGGCAHDHLHGTVYFDGKGPIPDPDPGGCGHAFSPD